MALKVYTEMSTGMIPIAKALQKAADDFGALLDRFTPDPENGYDQMDSDIVFALGGLSMLHGHMESLIASFVGSGCAVDTGRQISEMAANMESAIAAEEAAIARAAE